MIYISGKGKSFEITTRPEEKDVWYVHEIGKPAIVSRTVRVEEEYIIYLPSGNVLDKVPVDFMRNSAELYLWIADRFKNRKTQNYGINFPDNYWATRRRRRTR